MIISVAEDADANCVIKIYYWHMLPERFFPEKKSCIFTVYLEPTPEHFSDMTHDYKRQIGKNEFTILREIVGVQK